MLKSWEVWGNSLGSHIVYSDSTGVAERILRWPPKFLPLVASLALECGQGLWI